MGLNFIRKIKEIKLQLDLIIQKKNDERGLAVADYLETHLYNNPKYKDSNRLNKYEYQAFSQYGEDGIIEEIFNRIGRTNKYFIEFGVENGLECNSLNLLYNKWNGLWIEGSNAHYNDIAKRFSGMIGSKQLTVKNEFITAENIESIFKSADAPAEPDMLSIDIDYNDYYVWQAIKNYKPRVVVIEYNSVFHPGTDFVVDYDANRSWDGSSYFGASITALERLGTEKGYSLVACSYAGTNAFFVRTDLIADKFEGPFTAANHFEPLRYFLFAKTGHRRDHRP
jgi:hypothetical protein